MRFRATEDQVKQVVIRAIMASSPVGMGLIHYNKNLMLKPSDIELLPRGIVVDYYGGRMVKLTIRRNESDWEILNYGREPDIEYQSWAVKYPTHRALLESVPGVEINAA